MTDQPYTPVNTDPAPVKKSRKGTIIGSLVGLVAGIIIGAAAAGGDSSSPVAPTAGATVTSTVEVPGPAETITVPAPPPITITPDPVASTTCADAREAFLTGDTKDIEKALKALQADKGADQTAREYAKYWLGRDRGDRDMQTLDEGLIQSACGIL